VFALLPAFGLLIQTERARAIMGRYLSATSRADELRALAEFFAAGVYALYVYKLKRGEIAEERRAMPTADPGESRQEERLVERRNGKLGPGPR
jgi:hypothetical protein